MSMKYCCTFIASLFFFLNVAKSQDLPVKRIATIESFITALFRENKSQKFIIKNYMYLPSNDTTSLKKKERFISNSLDSLKKRHNSLVFSPGYKIVSYVKFKGEKKMFSESLQDIAIITVHDKPVIYLCFYDDKIYSFTLIKKGKYSYFIIV
ncbi:hypothetical protein IWX76_002624 [Pedobacter sp. CAN_A7]